MILLDVPPSAPYLLSVFAERGLDPEVRYHTSSYEPVRLLVARDPGFALLISRPAGDLSYDGQPVIVLPIAGQPRSIDVVLTWPRDGRLPARANAFLNHLWTMIPTPPGDRPCSRHRTSEPSGRMRPTGSRLTSGHGAGCLQTSPRVIHAPRLATTPVHLNVANVAIR